MWREVGWVGHGLVVRWAVMAAIMPVSVCLCVCMCLSVCKCKQTCEQSGLALCVQCAMC